MLTKPYFVIYVSSCTANRLYPAKVRKRFVLPQKVEITAGVCNSTGSQNPELAEKRVGHEFEYENHMA